MTDQQTFCGIMFFYLVLSYVIFPFAFYYYKKTWASAGQGFVVGSLLSVILWVTYGSKMIKE